MISESKASKKAQWGKLLVQIGCGPLPVGSKNTSKLSTYLQFGQNTKMACRPKAAGYNKNARTHNHPLGQPHCARFNYMLRRAVYD